jgi:thiol-disulfide isomerase/thioredoxin
VLLLAIASFITFPSRSAVAQPANNHFANAFLLTGSSLVTTGSNVGATSEPGEPVHGGAAGGSSVWWKWTATQSGHLMVSTAGSTVAGGAVLDTVLAIYTGANVSALTLKDSNDDASNPHSYTSKLTVAVQAGTTCFIAVDGYAFVDGAAVGTIRLALTYMETLPTSPAPSWVLPSMQGTNINWTNYSGKVVLVNFWATWCGPCIAVIADLVALQNQYAQDGFTVVGISVDNSVGGAPPFSLVQSFSGTHQINYPVVMSRPTSTVESDYGGIPAIPSTFIIDRRNNIVRQVVGSQTKAYFESLVRPFIYADTRLQAVPGGGGLRMAWPANQASFVVEGSDSLYAPNWLPVAVTPQVQGTNRIVNLPTTGTNKFYRLKLQ